MTDDPSISQLRQAIATAVLIGHPNAPEWRQWLPHWEGLAQSSTWRRGAALNIQRQCDEWLTTINTEGESNGS